MKNIEIDEIRVDQEAGELTRVLGTVQEEEFTVQSLIWKYYELLKEIERKEKVLTNTQEILYRMGDRVYDYYK